MKSSYPAYSTTEAVELFLVLVIIQFTLEAEIFPKSSPASVTILLHWLPQTADTALNLNKGTRVFKMLPPLKVSSITSVTSSLLSV